MCAVSQADLGRKLNPSKRSLHERSDIRGWFAPHIAARMRPGTSLGEGVGICDFQLR